MTQPDPDAFPEARLILEHYDAAFGAEALAAAADGWGAAWRAGRIEPAPGHWLSGPCEGEQ